jgi:hypothetical protein
MKKNSSLQHLKSAHLFLGFPLSYSLSYSNEWGLSLLMVVVRGISIW